MKNFLTLILLFVSSFCSAQQICSLPKAGPIDSTPSLFVVCQAGKGAGPSHTFNTKSDSILAWLNRGLGTGNFANINLSNLSSTAINTDLVPGVDNDKKLGSITHIWNGAYMKTLFLSTPDRSNLCSLGFPADSTLSVVPFNLPATNGTDGYYLRFAHDGSSAPITYWSAGPSGGSSPLTTKGDIYTHSSSANARLGVGSNGQYLSANSSAPNGIQWFTPATLHFAWGFIPGNYTTASGFNVIVDTSDAGLCTNARADSIVRALAAVGGGAWGSITGTLSSQTDLQTALNAKQNTITPGALTKVNDTNVTLTLGGTPGTALLQATSLTLGWTGTLADGRIASASTWNAKQNAISTGTTSQYIDGTLALQTFPTSLPVPNALTVGTGLALNSGTTFNGSAARTITNTGVLSNIAGTGISVSGATGAVTITNSSPWSAVTATPPLSISGNTLSLTTPLSATFGGTGIDSHTSTGVVQVSSGTYSVTPTLANGTSCTTQSAGNSTGLTASTAFVTTAVNNAIAGANPAVAVQVATIANVSGYTYNNGVSGIGATLTQNSAAVVVIDGYTLLLGDRILFKNQSTAANNGVYFVSTLGTGIIPAVFTRALDYDQPSDMNNTGSIPVVNGSQAGTGWLLTSTVNTVGTDALTYILYTLAQSTIITNSTSAGGDLTGTYPNPTIASQTSNSGKFLTTNGTNVSWASVGGTVVHIINPYTSYTIPDSRNYIVIVTAVGTASTVSPPASPTNGQTVYISDVVSGEIDLAAGWGLPYTVHLYGSGNTFSVPNSSVQLIYQNGAWSVQSLYQPITVTSKTVLDAVAMSTLNTNGYSLVSFYPAAGSGYGWQVVNASIKYTFNSADQTFSTIQILPIGGAFGTNYQKSFSCSPTGGSYFMTGVDNGSVSSSTSNMIDNAGLMLQSDSDDTAPCDGTFTVYITAQLIKE